MCGGFVWVDFVIYVTKKIVKISHKSVYKFIKFKNLYFICEFKIDKILKN